MGEPLDQEELLTRRVDGFAVSYDDTRMLLYNLGIGMGRDPLDERELPFVFEQPRLKIVPTAASVLGGSGARLLGGVPIDWPLVLHGEQRLTLHRPLPPAATLIVDSRVSEVVDKGAGKGAIVTVASSARLADGSALYEVENVMFARGNGGGGGPAQPARPPRRVPERAPDMVHVTETRPDQALLYRLNGDRNPLHAEPAFAGRAGFPRPILHGLCSYGIACRALLASICDYEPARIGSFDVRFTAPVFPGETIHTDIWVDGDVASFRCRVAARGVVSIDNGHCRLAAPTMGEEH